MSPPPVWSSQTTITPPAPSLTIDGESWLGGVPVTRSPEAGHPGAGVPSTVALDEDLGGARDVVPFRCSSHATKKPPEPSGT